VREQERKRKRARERDQLEIDGMTPRIVKEERADVVDQDEVPQLHAVIHQRCRGRSWLINLFIFC
jgi:hypothetical protein